MTTFGVWIAGKDNPPLKYLVFDSKFTNYQNLSILNESKSNLSPSVAEEERC